MRVFGIQPDGQFSEYLQTPFKINHEEAVLEGWLEYNPDGIVEDGRILIIGRQVSTNFGGFIDLLAVDRDGDVVVVELKRDRTPRDTIAQSLEYVSFAEQLNTIQLEEILSSYLNDESLSLAEHHREYFDLAPAEAIAFNKDQRIVIVGQRITPETRQTATFLRNKGIRVTCVEFTFFQAKGGTRLLSQEIVVGKVPGKQAKVTSGSLPVVTEDAFLSSLDDNGKAVFSQILELAQRKSLPIRWGTKGFSLNANVGGTHIAICFVYPPDSVYKQTIRTSLRDRGGVERKSAVPEETIDALRKQAEKTGLFVPAGQDLKCHIARELTDAEIKSMIAWCEAVEEAIQKHGLKQ
ncbi:MAG: endonuclease NucS [Desulfurivibrio sp.]|nr:endonuclease NucS [Desulfurivibrio sp.]